MFSVRGQKRSRRDEEDISDIENFSDDNDRKAGDIDRKSGDMDRKSGDDTDDKWSKKLKRPRMSMVADEVETK